MVIYIYVHLQLQVQALNSECTVKSSSSLIGDRFFQLEPVSPSKAASPYRWTLRSMCEHTGKYESDNFYFL